MFWFFAKFAFCSSRSTRSCLQAVMDSFSSRMFWMFSWTSRLNQKPLFLEFSGFYILFSFQGSWCFRIERRRRDLNPRAATNDLLPFQGSPFNHLGTSALVDSHLVSTRLIFNSAPGTHLSGSAVQLAERVGFEPTRPCGQTVFKTASLWPLRYLSKALSQTCSLIIPHNTIFVKRFSKFFRFFILF